MLFNSYTFMIFLGCVLALHYLPLPWRVRKFNLLAASYVFYAAWNPPFVLLLWVSTMVDWFIGRQLHATKAAAGRRLLLVGSLAVNLGLLGFFKYSGFLLENFTALTGSLGINFSPAAPSIVLPVGISFYTFQTLSYTLDIYRRKMKPWGSLLDYAMYVTFFPQLVAGPIVRAAEFLPQCRQPRRATGRQLAWGLFLLTLGLFQKSVLADGFLAPVAEILYDGEGIPDFATAWVGTLAFTCQIFCDFSGYSTCAIGVGMCLGFSLPDNFRFPYAAIGFADFWRRWHISLSTWLRDYLYIPLGGNRRGNLRANANVLITMLLGGLWHGASWTFVAWGGLHGLYLVIERLLRARLGHMTLWRRRGVGLLLGLGTFALVCWTWVFFRAHTFSRAFTVAGAMLGHREAGEPLAFGPSRMATVLAIAGGVLATHWLMRNRTLESVVEKMPWWLRALILAGMFAAIATSTGGDRAFIYFQF